MRLAQRALGETAGSLRTEPEPDVGFGAVEEIGEPAVPATADESRRGERGGAWSPSVPESGQLVTEVAREGTSGPPAAPPLAPIPSIVPPSSVDDPRATLPDALETAPLAPAAPPTPAGARVRETPGGGRALRIGAHQVAARVTPSPRSASGHLIAPPPAPSSHPRRERADQQAAITSIDVSIGRVEVRVRAPAAPTRERRDRIPVPQPALPLDEYLRSREASS